MRDQQHGTWQQHGGDQGGKPEFLPRDLKARKAISDNGGRDNGQDH
ncbi:hypothetical protein YPPY05_2001, partial [Yersinia pestis PY-05]